MLNIVSSMSEASRTFRQNSVKPAAAAAALASANTRPAFSTVNISDQGRAMAPQVAAPSDAAEQARLFEEVKMFCAIPKWYAAMMPALYAECGEGESLNTPERKAWFENLNSEASRVEYLGKLQDYYQKFLSEEGITSREAHYKVMVEDQSNSTRMHEKFREIILGDKRMIELASSMNWQI